MNSIYEYPERIANALDYAAGEKGWDRNDYILVAIMTQLIRDGVEICLRHKHIADMTVEELEKAHEEGYDAIIQDGEPMFFVKNKKATC